MKARDSIRWMPAFFAAVSLVAIQFVHFAVLDPLHSEDTPEHSHVQAAQNDSVPIGDHDDKHCATHSACHLLLHAMASAAQSDNPPYVVKQINLNPTFDGPNSRSVQPPTPPPLA